METAPLWEVYASGVLFVVNVVTIGLSICYALFMGRELLRK